MTKRWRIATHDPQRVADLGRAAGIPAVIAQLLLCRGISNPDVARDFLNAPLGKLRQPMELPGMEGAAVRLWEAVREGKRIVIYGDYDVDGVSGSSILLEALRLLKANVTYHIPHRQTDGYGLNRRALQSLAEEGAQVVVTVDCGITAVNEARLARELGLELIITDHHEMGDELPDALLVHPRLPGHDYPFAGLSGAGVAFKLAWALGVVAAGGSGRTSPEMREFLCRAMVLASLGTVADVVPLVDENRILVRHALQHLRDWSTLGLRTLLDVMNLNKSQYSSEDIGFGIGPRLNAAGRLGQARLAVELLTTRCPNRAQELAQYIDQLNVSRRSLEQSVYLAALKQAQEQFDPENDPALVLAGRGWHGGIIGIVAGRLAEKFNRPVVLLSLSELGDRPATGSCRSVPGFNIHEALQACSHRLRKFGGHAAAAGLSLDEDQIDHFRGDFCEYVAERITPEERVAELAIDVEAPLSAFTLKTVNQIEQLAPFGAGNARPLLCTTGVRLAGPPRKIGGGERHLSLHLEQHGLKLRSVAFGGADWADDLEKCQGADLAVAFRPKVNVYNGKASVELELADWKLASEL